MVFTYMGRVDEFSEVAARLRDPVPDGDLALPFEPVREEAYLETIAALFADDLDTASSAAQVASEIQDQPGLFWVEAPGWRASVAVAQGSLDQVVRHAQETFRRAEEMQSGDTAVVLAAHLALAGLAWEQNDLETAADHLAGAQRTVRPLLWMAVVVQLSVSRLQASTGEVDAARRDLTDAVQTYWSGSTPDSLRTQLHRTAIDLALRAGDVDDAVRWQQAHKPIGTKLGTALELRLAQAVGEDGLAGSIGARLAASDESLPRRIDALLAGANVLVAAGDDERAINLVAEATRLGEPRRFVRRFVEAGDPVLGILNRLTDPSLDPELGLASPAYVDLLITAAAAGATAIAARPAVELVDPLSDREIEVLERLSQGLSYRDMADQLFISRNTVKTHVRHVYAKLGVASRDGAVEEARRLGIA